MGRPGRPALLGAMAAAGLGSGPAEAGGSTERCVPRSGGPREVGVRGAAVAGTPAGGAAGAAAGLAAARCSPVASMNAASACSSTPARAVSMGSTVTKHGRGGGRKTGGGGEWAAAVEERCHRCSRTPEATDLAARSLPADCREQGKRETRSK